MLFFMKNSTAPLHRQSVNYKSLIVILNRFGWDFMIYWMMQNCYDENKSEDLEALIICRLCYNIKSNIMARNAFSWSIIEVIDL